MRDLETRLDTEAEIEAAYDKYGPLFLDEIRKQPYSVRAEFRHQLRLLVRFFAFDRARTPNTHYESFDETNNREWVNRRYAAGGEEAVQAWGRQIERLAKALEE